MTNHDFQKAAEFIRGHVDAGAGGSDPARRARFIEALEDRKPPTGRRLFIVAAAAFCVVAIGVGINSHQHKIQTLTYRVGNSTELGEIGSYMSAGASSALDLNFSEGSRVVLEPGARGRVARATSHGATMVLEDGRASVDVVHKPDTDWRILAGPYVVQVAGTSFEVSYDVATQTFSLDMRSGVVRVSGPGLSVPGEIRGTQRLQLSLGGTAGNSVTPTAPVTRKPSAAAEAVPAEANIVEQRAATVDAPPHSETFIASDKKKGVESWSLLGRKAQHHKIIELAEGQGIDHSLESASGPDLFALANAARFSGKQRLADRAYHAVRSRFASSAEATSAAFFLGRIHESSDSAAAIGWYEQYVAEAPSGAWVAEALGRRMVLLNAAQGAEGARKAAEDYLLRFATGPYAGFAQKILQP
jgi:TolA-binding protein